MLECQIPQGLVKLQARTRDIANSQNPARPSKDDECVLLTLLLPVLMLLQEVQKPQHQTIVTVAHTYTKHIMSKHLQPKQYHKISVPAGQHHEHCQPGVPFQEFQVRCLRILLSQAVHDKACATHSCTTTEAWLLYLGIVGSRLPISAVLHHRISEGYVEGFWFHQRPRLRLRASNQEAGDSATGIEHRQVQGLVLVHDKGCKQTIANDKLKTHYKKPTDPCKLHYRRTSEDRARTYFGPCAVFARVKILSPQP